MRKTTLALLCMALVTLGACTGTQTCVATGLSPNRVYEYNYTDSDGVSQGGALTSDANGTLTVTGVDGGINCSDMDIRNPLPVYIAN
jgi:hypothetical protein